MIETASSKNPTSSFDVFKAFIARLAMSATAAKQYVYKLFLVSLVLNGLMLLFIYRLYGAIDFVYFLLAFFAVIPSLLTYFVYGRLRDVCDLPEQLESIKGNLDEVNKSIEESGLLAQLRDFAANKELSLKARIKLIAQIAPSLLRLKSGLQDVCQVDVVFTVLAVTNPLFVGILVSAIVPVVVWGLISFVLGLVCLF